MVKKIAVLLVCFYILGMVGRGVAGSGEDAEKKAEEFHRRAMSDVIFIDEELKALYYQNIQIISLLKEIRELLSQKLEDIKESLKELEDIKESLKGLEDIRENLKERQEKAE